MVLGFNLRDSLRKRDNRLDDIISLIRDKYVDTVDNGILYKDAVSGILQSLDPHTVYIPAEELEDINEDLDGGFSGIGVEFSIVRDTIEVTSVVENGPASKAGVEVGDQLLKVGDSLVAGINITSARIIKMLKGKQSSNVDVTLKNPLTDAIKQFPITRDIIPTYSVEASIMVDNTTGLIKINRFSATTYKEFNAALRKLIDQGATRLIIDLRDNPGGYLDAATSIADDLLDKDKLIVYTKGVHAPKKEYKAGESSLFEQGKLAILVDESSASASEILAGAVQDWDRGVIIGRRTYGKGLVQQQYEMTDGAALRLTIAKYYTPSGRSIQRSFDKGRDAYIEDYEKRFESGELIGKDSASAADTVPFYTAGHRIVYGGGGITPDVYVPYDTSRLSPSLMNVIFSQELKSAIWDYFIRNRKSLKFKTIKEFSASFDPAVVTSNYFALLSPDARKGTMKELARPVNDSFFKLQIKAQMARYLFHDNGYYAISFKDDNVVNKALQIMNSNKYSELISRK